MTQKSKVAVVGLGNIGNYDCYYFVIDFTKEQVPTKDFDH